MPGRERLPRHIPDAAPQVSKPARTTTTPAVVVIPCGRRKLDRPAPAGELYVGGQHRLARAAADRLVSDPAVGGIVLILSAKYGLLRTEDVIAPYDVTIGDPAAVLPSAVRAQTAGLIPRAAFGGPWQVVSLLPAAYAALLDEALRYTGREMTVTHALAGTRGIGEQRARLAALARDGWAALPG